MNAHEGQELLWVDGLSTLLKTNDYAGLMRALESVLAHWGVSCHALHLAPELAANADSAPCIWHMVEMRFPKGSECILPVGAPSSSVLPLVLHAQTRTTPVAWSKHFFSEQRSTSAWSWIQSVGLIDGVSFPLVLGKTGRGLLSLARESAAISSVSPAPVSERHLQLLASAVQARLSSVVHTEIKRRMAPHLTPQELECLRWVAQGKTLWEVGRIMGVAESTATFHLKNVMKKFKVGTRIQAVNLAQSWGLID